MNYTCCMHHWMVYLKTGLSLCSVYFSKRRADANQSGASSSHMLPPHTMADSSDDESLVASSTGRPLSSRPSWHLSSREIKCEISGVTPLPEDEQDGDNALSTAPAVRQATSGSSQAAPTSKTMLKRSKRKHFVTPAPQKMPAAACGMVPKVCSTTVFLWLWFEILWKDDAKISTLWCFDVDSGVQYNCVFVAVVRNIMERWCKNQYFVMFWCRLRPPFVWPVFLLKQISYHVWQIAGKSLNSRKLSP